MRVRSAVGRASPFWDPDLVLDGYVVTFTTDVANDRSECLVFDARSIADGPLARMRLPERISSGTHTYWLAR